MSKPVASNAWHIDPSVYDKAKSMTTEQSVYSKSKKAPYILIDGGPEDKKKVAELYQRSSIPGYEISKVEVIYNKTLVQGFEAKIQALEQRYDNTAFDPKWRKETKDDRQKKLRERVEYTLINEVQKYAIAHRHVKVLPMFHGTHQPLYDSIFRAGFDNLASTDSGYFGKGIYNTSYAEYAWRVYSTGGLIFNWIAFYSAFPVIPEDMKFLVGSAKYQNYDAHYALVRPMNPNKNDEKVYIPINLNDKPSYDELIVFESSQVLPRYIVSISPVGLNLKKVDSKGNKKSLMNKMDILWKKAKPSLQGALKQKIEAMQEKRLGDEELNKEEEWLHDKIDGILENEDNQNPDIKNVLIDQLENILKLSKKGLSPSDVSVSPQDESSKVESPREKADIKNDKPAPKTTTPKPLPKTWHPGKVPSPGPEGKMSELDEQVNRGYKFASENNDGEAYKCYKKAADKGHAHALYLVGQCYKLGKGVAQDYNLALEYAQMAADKDNPDAQDYVGHCYYNGYSVTQNYETAVSYFKKAASRGNISSMLYLASCLTNGSGIALDDEGAVRYWKMAADGGNPIGQYQLSLCYRTGKGTDKNYALAVEYARKSADGGNTDAQDYYGHCCYNGLSVPQNYKTAFDYFKKGAAQNNPSSQEYLGLCYAHGQGVDIDVVESAKYYQLSADQGRAHAQFAIGRYYLEGVGVTKDLQKAKDYLTLAANQGIEDAKGLIEKIK